MVAAVTGGGLDNDVGDRWEVHVGSADVSQTDFSCGAVHVVTAAYKIIPISLNFIQAKVHILGSDVPGLHIDQENLNLFKTNSQFLMIWHD